MKLDITELYKTQISLSEWFDKASHKAIEEFRVEDNEKRERLRVLNRLIGMPYDAPVQFSVLDIEIATPKFKKFLVKHGSELCALRLIPLDPKLPKLRMRGQKIKDVVSKWYKEQNIDTAKYRAEFIPHSDNPIWSTIFVVTKKGVFGEIIQGGHYQLTQGFHDTGKPILFTSDFNKITLHPWNRNAEKEVKEILDFLKIKIGKQVKLKKLFGSQFQKNYLLGYFETIKTKENGLWFLDYNRVLGKLYESYDVDFEEDVKSSIKGRIASKGSAQGKVKIVPLDKLLETDFIDGEVLVCEMTTPDYLPLIWSKWRSKISRYL